MVARDNIDFLQAAIEPLVNYAKQIVVIDAGCHDICWRFLQAQKAEHPEWDWTFKRVSPRIISDYGFSFLKNMAAGLATCEWIHSLDSDEGMVEDDYSQLRGFLSHCEKPVVSITTRTYNPHEMTPPMVVVPEGGLIPTDGVWAFPRDWDKIVGTKDLPFDDFTHRRIYRNGVGITWRGYIHEELHALERNCNSGTYTQPSNFIHHHFTNFRAWGNPQYKQWRYAWMLLRAYRTESLRRYTNDWWYKTHVPNHLEAIEKEAAHYIIHRDAIDPERYYDDEGQQI